MLCNHRLPERMARHQISRWKALVGQEGITLAALGQGAWQGLQERLPIFVTKEGWWRQQYRGYEHMTSPCPK